MESKSEYRRWMAMGPAWVKGYLRGGELTFGVVAFEGVEVVLLGAAVLFAHFGVADCDADGLGLGG